MREEFLRTESLIGQENISKLNNAAVAVFGIGGVGSYALETLVRCGVGTVCIFDNDTVSKSNINRQLIALNSTVGELKVTVAKKRCLDINPDVKIIENSVFVTPETKINFRDFDFVIDAVDNVTTKLYIIESCKASNIPVISVMGTGNKLNPTLVKINDIYSTSGCPLARVMRHELKKRGIVSLDVVWSDEKPVEPFDCGEYRDTGRVSPGSMSPVPSVAGITAAYKAIKTILDL